MKTNRIELYNDGIGFVEKHDFSMANTSHESRIKAVTTVASICYDAPHIIDSINIYDKLGAESLGLPSSSYEFVPLLIEMNDVYEMMNEADKFCLHSIYIILDVEKYGTYVISETGREYLLTNLRACLSDQNKYQLDCIDFKTYFNTSPEEIQIIKDNFRVFFEKIPLFVARQLVRHRVQSLQELSRRYTDDKSSPIEFYIKDGEVGLKIFYDMAKNFYNNIVDKKELKAEDARAVLPTALYTKIWSSFTPSGYDNFIKLRTKKNAQSEIRDLANAMEELCLTKQN